MARQRRRAIIGNGLTLGTAAAHAALGVRVTAVEDDIHEIKTHLSGLETKLDSAFANISAQIATVQKTPWASLFGGATVVLSVLGFIGAQALSPLNSDVTKLKTEIVTRAEHDSREKSLDL